MATTERLFQSCPGRSRRFEVEGFVLDLLRHKLCEPGMIDEPERRVRDRVEARMRSHFLR